MVNTAAAAPTWRKPTLIGLGVLLVFVIIMTVGWIKYHVDKKIPEAMPSTTYTLSNKQTTLLKGGWVQTKAKGFGSIPDIAVPHAASKAVMNKVTGIEVKDLQDKCASVCYDSSECSGFSYNYDTKEAIFFNKMVPCFDKTVTKADTFVVGESPDLINNTQLDGNPSCINNNQYLGNWTVAKSATLPKVMGKLGSEVTTGQPASGTGRAYATELSLEGCLDLCNKDGSCIGVDSNITDKGCTAYTFQDANKPGCYSSSSGKNVIYKSQYDIHNNKSNPDLAISSCS